MRLTHGLVKYNDTDALFQSYSFLYVITAANRNLKYSEHFFLKKKIAVAYSGGNFRSSATVMFFIRHFLSSLVKFVGKAAACIIPQL